MQRYLSWSGGKDSSASIVLCYEKGIHLDGVVFSEVMFSHERNISGENPKYIKWVYEVAKPIIEKMGYPVIILRDKEDYFSLFNHRISTSKVTERVGKKRGWLIGGKCAANDKLKMRPLRKFFKGMGEVEQIVGIAFDEVERLERLALKPNRRSILADYRVCEFNVFEICKAYNLLSPLYEFCVRSGCWFCPNNSIKFFANFAKEYPDLWAELEKLSHDEEIVTQGFKYGQTFESVNREVDLINNQISIFDFV